MRPFNKTTATLVRPHPFSTLCTTPLGKMTLCYLPTTAYNLSGFKFKIFSMSTNNLRTTEDLQLTAGAGAAVLQGRV